MDTGQLQPKAIGTEVRPEDRAAGDQIHYRDFLSGRFCINNHKSLIDHLRCFLSFAGMNGYLERMTKLILWHGF